jgi:hypothetical protein
MNPKPKRDRFLIAWQDENGKKDWHVATSKSNAEAVHSEIELADGTPIAISYKTVIKGTSWRPAAHKRMKSRAGGINWEINTYEKFKELLDGLWDTNYGSIREGRKYLLISTGGWSENEFNLSQLQRTAYWFVHWARTERGGHYTIEIKRGPLK